MNFSMLSVAWRWRIRKLRQSVYMPRANRQLDRLSSYRFWSIDVTIGYEYTKDHSCHAPVSGRHRQSSFCTRAHGTAVLSEYGTEFIWGDPSHVGQGNSI